MKTTITAYHGSKSEFEKFEFGKNDGTTYSKGQEGYFTSSKEIAETYGNVKEFELTLNNPLIIDFCGNLFTNFHLTNNDELKLKIWESIHEVHINYANMLLRISKSNKPVSLENRIGLNHIIKFAKLNGYDGVIAENIIDASYKVDNLIATDYVVFNESSIN